MAGTTVVDVKSAWVSKINWTQAVGVAATVVAVVTSNKIAIPAEQQVEIVALIQAAQGIATWVIKTWFTPSVTAGSVGSAAVSK